MTPKEHTETLIGYFDWVNTQYPNDKWGLGRDAARKWLKLINASSVSQAEVADLIAVIDKNKYEGSGWFDLASGVSFWATTNGFSTPIQRLAIQAVGHA